MQYWHTDKHTEQWKKIESPVTNPFIYGELICDKDVKTINRK